MVNGENPVAGPSKKVRKSKKTEQKKFEFSSDSEPPSDMEVDFDPNVAETKKKRGRPAKKSSGTDDNEPKPIKKKPAAKKKAK